VTTAVDEKCNFEKLSFEATKRKMFSFSLWCLLMNYVSRRIRHFS
jgi:hypothetical protein